MAYKEKPANKHQTTGRHGKNHGVHSSQTTQEGTHEKRVNRRTGSASKRA